MGPERQMDMRFWINPQMLATPLFCLAVDRYPDLLEEEWDPETLRMEIQDDCGAAPPQLTIDKVYAALSIVKTDRFYTHLPSFINLCNVLGGSIFDPTVFDPADALECAWGVTEAMVLYPLDEDSRTERYSPEIVGYIEQALKAEGISKPPGILRELGIKDDDVAANGWRDDPAVFEAVWSAQNEKADDIETAVGQRLRMMRDQLATLPLQRGSTKNLVDALSRFLSHYGM